MARGWSTIDPSGAPHSPPCPCPGIPAARTGFPLLTAKLESVIFVKQSCPALPVTYIRAKHAARCLLSTSKGSRKAAASPPSSGNKSLSYICSIQNTPGTKASLFASQRELRSQAHYSAWIKSSLPASSSADNTQG